MYNLNCEILCPWVKGSKVSIDYRAIIFFFLINNQNSSFVYLGQILSIFISYLLFLMVRMHHTEDKERTKKTKSLKQHYGKIPLYML